MEGKYVQDPIYGFVTIPRGDVARAWAHTYVQRLRRISQLGLTEFVYPSATHTRFQHIMGSLHLMQEVISWLRSQGTSIEEEEEEAALMAALLHDVGHGPFSHTIEGLLLSHSHEEIGIRLISMIEEEMKMDLSLARCMLEQRYERSFFSELLSGPLDVDRMDYLHRDSFFTGVSEGHINVARLLKVLCVRDGHIDMLDKGRATVEDFFHARSMMYRQVYHHKTVLAASAMLRSLIRRARDLALEDRLICMTPALTFCLRGEGSDEELLRSFVQLNDAHLWVHLQYWSTLEDQVLSELSSALIRRDLWKVEFGDRKFSDNFMHNLEERIQKKLNLQIEEVVYYIVSGDLREKQTGLKSRSSLERTQQYVSTGVHEVYYISYPK